MISPRTTKTHMIKPRTTKTHMIKPRTARKTVALHKISTAITDLSVLVHGREKINILYKSVQVGL